MNPISVHLVLHLQCKCWWLCIYLGYYRIQGVHIVPSPYFVINNNKVNELPGLFCMTKGGAFSA